MIKKLFVLAAFIGLTGCQAMVYGTADDLQKIQIGMPKAEVLKIMGEPIETAADAKKHEEVLTFKRMAGIVSWAPHAYDVALVDGKVVKYGRR